MHVHACTEYALELGNFPARRSIHLLAVLIPACIGYACIGLHGRQAAYIMTENFYGKTPFRKKAIQHNNRPIWKFTEIETSPLQVHEILELCFN
jgi:hypothetical protein